MTQQEINEIADKAEVFTKINITEFFTMLLAKAQEWKARVS